MNSLSHFKLSKNSEVNRTGAELKIKPGIKLKTVLASKTLVKSYDLKLQWMVVFLMTSNS